MRQKIKLFVNLSNISTFFVLFFVIFMIFKVSWDNKLKKEILWENLSSKILENSFKIIDELSYNNLKSHKNQVHIMFFGDLIYDRSVYI